VVFWVHGLILLKSRFEQSAIRVVTVEPYNPCGQSLDYGCVEMPQLPDVRPGSFAFAATKVRRRGSRLSSATNNPVMPDRRAVHPKILVVL